VGCRQGRSEADPAALISLLIPTPPVPLFCDLLFSHWFYEDYLRPLNPLLPSLSQRHFTQLIISSSPMYSSLAGDEGVDYDNVWAEYISYKSMVPCCGGILINQDGDKVSAVSRDSRVSGTVTIATHQGLEERSQADSSVLDGARVEV
jgi:hypothetical protein